MTNADDSQTPSAALAPMGPDDFDRLDDALDALRESFEEIPQWEFCEGFMAGLMCTRRPIEPAEYWPVLFGDDFVPAQHMELVWGWMRRWKEIETALDADVEALDDERAWQPEVLDTRGSILDLPAEEQARFADDDIPSFAQVFALGFMYVVENWPDEWAEPRDKEAAALLDEHLMCIVALTEDDTAPPDVSMFRDDGPPSVSHRRIDHFGAAIWAMYDLRLFWRAMGPRAETIRKEAEPGRNDPCPCGSGKKYKKCHGA
ncbi:MAG: UPF0149 family protein [Gammaproteobacteria bacterium]|nr:UPF0149 family protein [Gammaproteobacteria bacterium]MBU2407275.1 UPF0149 family protein [Gammaproteobacteria bacterium]